MSNPIEWFFISSVKIFWSSLETFLLIFRRYRFFSHHARKQTRNSGLDTLDYATILCFLDTLVFILVVNCNRFSVSWLLQSFIASWILVAVFLAPFQAVLSWMLHWVLDSITRGKLLFLIMCRGRVLLWLLLHLLFRMKLLDLLIHAIWSCGLDISHADLIIIYTLHPLVLLLGTCNLLIRSAIQSWLTALRALGLTNCQAFLFMKFRRTHFYITTSFYIAKN